MVKKITILVLSLIIITGCTSSTSDEKASDKSAKDEKTYKTLNIKTKLLNKESDDGVYLVYLMPVGLRDEEPGKANQSGYYGPFETDKNGEVFIDLEYNDAIARYLKEDENEKKNHLEVFITTLEDIYIRNPLNEKTEIKFIEGDSDEFMAEFPFYSSVPEIEVPFTDKYPDGVLSLTFQDADFVIKFEFEDGFVPTTSYEASIFWFDPTMSDGIGIVRLGRINRKFQYWDTPFYKNETGTNRTGTIIIDNFDTDEKIMYEGYPKTVSFDGDGNCIEGDIVTIKILKHD